MRMFFYDSLAKKASVLFVFINKIWNSTLVLFAFDHWFLLFFVGFLSFEMRKRVDNAYFGWRRDEKALKMTFKGVFVLVVCWPRHIGIQYILPYMSKYQPLLLATDDGAANVIIAHQPLPIRPIPHLRISVKKIDILATFTRYSTETASCKVSSQYWLITVCIGICQCFKPWLCLPLTKLSCYISEK